MIPVPLNNRLVVNLQEAAELTGIGIGSLREMAQQPSFPSFRIGKKIFIHVDELNKFFARKALSEGVY